MSKTYADIPKKFSKLETSEIVIIPVPYDGTSTWQKGADKGPEALIEASEHVELYDIETDTEVYKKGIFLSEEIVENTSPEKMTQAVHKETNKYLDLNKFVVLIGGEHSVSIGAIEVFSKKNEDLTVLHLDAHADLLKEYMGSEFNHACSMYKAKQKTNLVQVGIRSMEISEKKEMNFDNTFFAQDIQENDNWINEVVGKITDKVYITIDLDVFDPSILPSTGTPEPGGLLWYQTLELLKKVAETKKIVGFDIVELCPNDIDKSSDFLAAKLCYKLLSYIFK